MDKENDTIHIAFEETNFIWGRRDVAAFTRMYKAGIQLEEIAEHFGRTTIEVLMLALDRIEKGKIPVRKGWRLW